jgi:hypothetical protein
MDVFLAMDLWVGVGGGASAITEGSAVEGEGRVWEGAVRGARVGAVRGAGEEQFAARGVRDAGGRRKTRTAAGITGGGVVRPVDALRPPLRISRDEMKWH